MSQKWRNENFTLFSSNCQNFAPFPRYGRLKSKFLSLCISSSCLIDLTKSRYTWSLTAVPSTLAGWYCKEMMARRSLPIFARSYLYSCSMWEIFIRAQFDAQVNLDTRSLNSQQSQKSCGKKQMNGNYQFSFMFVMFGQEVYVGFKLCLQANTVNVGNIRLCRVYAGFKSDMSHCHYSGGRKG